MKKWKLEDIWIGFGQKSVKSIQCKEESIQERIDSSSQCEVISEKLSSESIQVETELIHSMWEFEF